MKVMALVNIEIIEKVDLQKIMKRDCVLFRIISSVEKYFNRANEFSSRLE